jgi:hypothetical protein
MEKIARKQTAWRRLYLLKRALIVIVLLHYEADCGSLEELVWCLEDDMDVNSADMYRGYTPTHWLTDMATVDGLRVEMLRELVRHGADVNQQTPNGTPPLMLARAAGSNLGDGLVSELVTLGARDL